MCSEEYCEFVNLKIMRHIASECQNGDWMKQVSSESAQDLELQWLSTFIDSSYSDFPAQAQDDETQFVVSTAIDKFLIELLDNSEKAIAENRKRKRESSPPVTWVRYPANDNCEQYKRPRCDKIMQHKDMTIDFAQKLNPSKELDMLSAYVDSIYTYPHVQAEYKETPYVITPKMDNYLLKLLENAENGGSNKRKFKMENKSTAVETNGQQNKCKSKQMSEKNLERRTCVFCGIVYSCAHNVWRHLRVKHKVNG